MTTTVLVTGGTGTIGRLVVPMLRDAGRDVRVLSRSSNEFPCDLLKGEGLDAALSGVDTILHLAGGPKGDDIATRNLVQAARRQGVKHIVYISVIGADKLPLGYFQQKHVSERIIAESGIPWTTIRVAQLHELVLKTAAAMAKSPIVPAPGAIRFQPVSGRDVAARLAELTLGAPAGLVADLAGPTVYPLPELIRGYVRAQGKRRAFLPVPLGGKVGRAYRNGDNLNLSTASVGIHTWEEFLAAQV